MLPDVSMAPVMLAPVAVNTATLLVPLTDTVTLPLAVAIATLLVPLTICVD